MPLRLRPTAPAAANAILVGDPGRALLLAQELLELPKMSNHARGLWGYSGQTSAGHDLTIQSTGIGGPSATLVLGDLSELGVRRVVRVGTCVGLDQRSELGQLLVATEAIAIGGSVASLGTAAGASVRPSADLTERLERELGDRADSAVIASFDTHPSNQSAAEGIVAADMQTAPLLARARSLGIEAAALLIVAETDSGGQLGKEELELVEKLAGQAASAVLSG